MESGRDTAGFYLNISGLDEGMRQNFRNPVILLCYVSLFASRKMTESYIPPLGQRVFSVFVKTA